jgi:hypothetical protein
MLELVGSGKFSKVYRLNKKKVIIKSCDPIKGCMAMDMFPQSKLFPKIEFVDSFTHEEYDFIMDYDPEVKSKTVIPKLNSYYQDMYRELRNLHFNRFNNFKEYQIAVNKLKIKSYHKKALIEAFFAIMNFIDEEYIKFEISPRNVSTRNGRLILQDCFYSNKAIY